MKNKQHQYQLNYFDKEFASIQEYKIAPWQESYIKRVTKYMLDGDLKQKTLLDIATGSGYIAVEMAKLGMNVVGCDLSSQAIKNLAKVKRKLKLNNLKPIKCYAENIPFKDKSFDYIVANAILEHIPAEKKAIGEWRRLLRSGGKMLITVPLKFRYIWPFLWPINFVHDKRIGHLRRYDLGDLQEKFRLRAVKVFYTGHLLKVLESLTALLIKNKKFDQYLEKYDSQLADRPYGASNISVIFVND